MERDTFVLGEALLLHESWIYARPDGWHEKKVSVLKGFCLFLMRLHIKGRFLVQKLTSSNVISEFCVIHKANGCECNCCHQWDCSSDFSWIGTGVALARQRFLTFEGTATDSEFPSRSTYVVYIRAILTATKDVHSTATGCKWLTFSLTSMM